LRQHRDFTESLLMTANIQQVERTELNQRETLNRRDVAVDSLSP
jgi:hypothetical protein